MKTTTRDAIIYSAFWLAVGLSISTSVVACSNYHQVYDIRELEVDEAVFIALRSDCQKRGGITYKSAFSKNWYCQLD